jgi:hypothetical protein
MTELIDQPPILLGIQRELVKADHTFKVPTPCPYCGGQLYAWTETWEQRDDGTWMAGCTMMTECESAPDIDGPDWDDWFAQHSEMPYTYMLPIESAFTNWVNARFNFDLEA